MAADYSTWLIHKVFALNMLQEFKKKKKVSNFFFGAQL